MVSDTIRQTVSERYAKAVTTGEEMCCPSGYDYDDLRTFIPEDVLKVSYGCGTPVGLTTVQLGETVLDIGSGGGIDCFAAARRVGPTGRVIGIDMTDEMLAMARSHAPTVAANLGYAEPNVEFRKGYADAMPVEDGVVDLIVSNCVINLAPDKRKVFREMHRVLKPGGRFTISDIVADRGVPNYLVYDKVKWGDCLSGALPLGSYWQGLRQAGFRGIHQVGFIPWRIIDGIHFLSLTLTGYKLADPPSEPALRYATLRGPFSRVVDEIGNVFVRGTPQAVDFQTAELLGHVPYMQHFLLTDEPVELTPQDSRWSAVRPEEAPCVWEGDFALATGPFLEMTDDDHHDFHCGEPLEICSKTRKVLDSEPYRPYFAIIKRAGEAVTLASAACGTNQECC